MWFNFAIQRVVLFVIISLILLTVIMSTGSKPMIGQSSSIHENPKDLILVCVRWTLKSLPLKVGITINTRCDVWTSFFKLYFGPRGTVSLEKRIQYISACNNLFPIAFIFSNNFMKSDIIFNIVVSKPKLPWKL